MTDDLITTHYLVLPVGKTGESRQVEWPAEPGYDAIKAVINPILGAELEHVTVLHNGEAADMFVDEMGALKQLPRNEAVTAIYRANRLDKHPTTKPETLPAIYGTAILFARRIWF